MSQEKASNLLKSEVLEVHKCLLQLVSLSRGDIDPFGACELQDLLAEDSTLLNCKEGIKLVANLSAISERLWLFEYKGRGYVLADMGNCHWDYECTVEEYLISLRYR